MPRIKLQRFAENANRPDIVEPGKANFGHLAGHWRPDFFQNTNPMVLEMGCGKGEYTVGLAQHHPDQNFLGLDIKGERIWRGSTRAEALGLTNVGFLRLSAHQLEDHFAPAELSEIWITFPDPRPRDRDIKRRLTAPRFLDMYQKLLAPGGVAQLKTDSEGLFAYTLEVLASRPGARLDVATRDLYAETDAAFAAAQAIQTHFEGKYRAVGVPIKYVRFML
ncbi:tRNA (guanosine(46)-N7)-methyltransferase TrmB [Hymenobacter sp. HMF4947]|uniref:tRNA (guanine-N(7)-)-methyltransferase n=1 Tax=Hymenobacter ginkgonis TaxID=2682976 RepID=A0A7K1TBF8_9BACT|nr:tRNA (guanosine(46)-N7)-methyltransferase TrmB [Hymenobacter ginkgonis]MVN75719.1 tRNA (guanosine(46)-N7)-methyltransferase TrmB [Hymenobacter ginkgonis]